MSKLTTYLAEININTFNALEKYIYSTDIETLLNLVIYIRDLINQDFSIPSYSPFSYVANDALSGTGGCSEVSCKTSRAIRFANFSALYADNIFIKLNTISHEHFDTFFEDIFTNQESEWDLRYNILCDINIINTYTALINANIVHIEPTRNSYCKDCFQKALLNIKKPIDITPIIDYVKQTATISITEYDAKDELMSIDITMQESFFDSESNIYTLNSQFLQKLPQKYKLLATLDKEIPVVSDFLQEIVESMFVDCCYYTSYCAQNNAKLITSTPANALFMQYTQTQSLVKESINTLASFPEYELPFSNATSLENILHLREIEQESFNRYRVALNKAVSEQLKTNISTDWENIYNDIIYPEFTNLNLKLRNIKSGAFKKTFKNILLSSLVVSAGVVSGAISTTVPEVITSLGGISGAIGLGNTLLNHNPPIKEQLRENDFYFLWKLNKC